MLHASIAAVMGWALVPTAAARRATAAVVWAFVAATVWTIQLLWWHFHASAQREAYYSLFACVGLVLVVASADRGPRASRVFSLLGGLALALPVFGKPTFAVFTGAALVSVIVEPPADGRSRLRRLGAFAAGFGIGAVLMLAFVLAFGSFRGFLFWHLQYVSVFYRYHDSVPVLRVIRAMHGEFAWTAIVPAVAGPVAIARGWLPRRALGLATAPLLALAVAVLQGKGWAYHYIPVVMTATTFLLFTLIHAWYAPRRANLDPRLSSAATLLLFVLAGTYLVVQACTAHWVDPEEWRADAPWLRTARDAATFLEHTTGPEDRVLYYGAEPAIPWLAGRLPATQYIVPWLLCGGRTGHVRRDLDAEAAARVNAMRAELTRAFCAQVEAKPPRAFVTSDEWCDNDDCVGEMGSFCPAVPRMIREHYQPPQSFGKNRVFLAR